jgi:hypothetical protein
MYGKIWSGRKEEAGWENAGFICKINPHPFMSCCIPMQTKGSFDVKKSC